MDNGPELTAAALRDWSRIWGTHTAYIEPGSPWETPFVESFNGRLRDECLNVEDFASILEAQVILDELESRIQQLPATPIPRRAHPRRLRCPMAGTPTPTRTPIATGLTNGSPSGAQRREWAKVQGRFEDVSFVDSPGQTRSLIGTVFSLADESLRARIDRWARPHAKRMRSLGIAELADPAVIASCYPLHPLATLVLPELCSRYGQHERTLFSFLAGPGPAGVPSFLRETNLPARGQLPSLGLDAVYDYFVASGALSISSARQSSRWTEIATRLRDSHGLTPSQTRMAKAIALLNLVSTTGGPSERLGSCSL